MTQEEKLMVIVSPEDFERFQKGETPVAKIKPLPQWEPSNTNVGRSVLEHEYYYRDEHGAIRKDLTKEAKAEMNKALWEDIKNTEEK